MITNISKVRNVLDAPVPRVLAWSSKASENAVGAEYIIMEQVAGVQLSQVWHKIRIQDKFEIVKAISRISKILVFYFFHQNWEPLLFMRHRRSERMSKERWNSR